jgi:hypothetical protein
MQFVSLADTVNAIAERVPVPEVREWSKPKRPILLPPAGVNVEVKQDTVPPEKLLIRVFQMSKAAAALDQALQNTPVCRPALFSDELTGLPRRSDAIQGKVDEILVEMARAFPRYERYWARRMSFWFNQDILRKYQPNISVGDARWGSFDVDERLTHHVGFDLREITVFLDAHKIQHSLPYAQDKPSSLEVDRNVSRQHLPMSEGIMRRASVLDPNIEKAIKEVGLNASAVFQLLYRQALDEVAPFDGVEANKILYTEGGEQKTLTKKMLANRIARRRKKQQ